MGTPSAKQIARKTTWSGEDEVELDRAVARARSTQARINLLSKRARSIEPDHPQAAAVLLGRILTEYPDRADYQSRDVLARLAALDARGGDPGSGAERLRQRAVEHPGRDDDGRLPLAEYSGFVLDHAVGDHYPLLLDLVAAEPRRDEDLTWALLCDAAYCAHLLGDDERSDRLLTRAEERRADATPTARDVYRRWLFHRTRTGGRRVAFALAAPGFTLAEFRDWAAQAWAVRGPDLDLVEIEKGERLVLAWPDYEVGLVLEADPAKAAAVVSRFPASRLEGFDVGGARALGWFDAGDPDTIDAVNVGVRLLDRFQEDPRIVLDRG